MRGDVDSVKERLDIAEVIGGYLKLEKAGANFKAKCPFHNEKTASFFISSARQSYYCFGCGEKGDIFTFVQEMEGIDFREALKTLASRAGVQLTNVRGENREDKDELFETLEEATKFFEDELERHSEALKYLLSRGVSKESIKEWRIGFARDEWRSLREHMLGKGVGDTTLTKAGLVKKSEDHKDREPYDVFRGRIIFPIFDSAGRVIAFSGRALGAETTPKYLNSPDGILFNKSEVLYGLDKAKNEIRKKDYTVLVEGQLDLVLSHQAGVKNTVASSGTAFTAQHLERLKRLSPRILLAFDGDAAGKKAAERSTILALGLGLEVKVANLPEGRDPADLVKEDPELWKDALRKAKPAIEVFIDDIIAAEKDSRKAGKLIEQKVLPLIALLGSSMERSHFVSLIAKRTGIKEEIIWEDLRRTKAPETEVRAGVVKAAEAEQKSETLRQKIEGRLAEVALWQKEFGDKSAEHASLSKEEVELKARLSILVLEEERAELRSKLGRGEEDEETARRIESLSKRLDEEKRKLL